MITKISTKGSNCIQRLSPENGLAWAKAGVTNIFASFVLCPLCYPRRRNHSVPASEIGADYSGHRPNCNVALP
jgi:hypothetical protein